MPVSSLSHGDRMSTLPVAVPVDKTFFKLRKNMLRNAIY